MELPAGNALRPLPVRQTVVSLLREQRLRLSNRLHTSPLQRSQVVLAKPPCGKRRSCYRSRDSCSPLHQESLHFFEPNRGARQRERWNQCMGPRAAPAPHSQDRDPKLVVILLIDPVTGETAEHPAVRAGFLADDDAPEEFYPVEAIVKRRTVDYYNCSWWGKPG